MQDQPGAIPGQSLMPPARGGVFAASPGRCGSHRRRCLRFSEGSVAPSVMFVNAFDAYAGSQRVGAMLVRLLRKAGLRVDVRLGFGNQGFVSDLPGASATFAVNTVAYRKLLYPMWLTLAAVRLIAPAVRGSMLWFNTVYSVPAALPVLLFRPSAVIVHIHEIEMPGIFRALLRFAHRRGATLVAVSSDHARRIGLPCRILLNAVGENPPPVARVGDRLVFIGDSRPFKGLDLFIAIAEEGVPWKPVAVLGGTPADYGDAMLDAARAAGVSCRFGLSDPAEMLRDGALLLQLTDPLRATETFSLTTAEAVWHCVPVGCTGSGAVAEVAGAALAFTIAEREPRLFAAAVRALADDPARHAALIAGAASTRSRYSEEAFRDGALAILGRPPLAIRDGVSARK